MLEQDYLMKMILQFFRAMVRSWELKEKEEDPQLAADSLETAISVATEMDGDVLLSLSPDSIAQVLRVSGTDPRVIEYVARGMLLESVYLKEAGNAELASVRAAQARALAADYGFDLPDDPSDFESITEGLDDPELVGGSAAAGGFGLEDEDLDDIDDLLESLNLD